MRVAVVASRRRGRLWRTMGGAIDHGLVPAAAALLREKSFALEKPFLFARKRKHRLELIRRNLHEDLRRATVVRPRHSASRVSAPLHTRKPTNPAVFGENAAVSTRVPSGCPEVHQRRVVSGWTRHCARRWLCASGVHARASRRGRRCFLPPARSSSSGSRAPPRASHVGYRARPRHGTLVRSRASLSCRASPSSSPAKRWMLSEPREAQHYE